MNNKGFAISGVVYGILIVFLLLVFSVLGMVVNRKSSLDRVKEDAMDIVLNKKSVDSASIDFSKDAISTTWETMYVPKGVEITDAICKSSAVSKLNYNITCTPSISTSTAGEGVVVFKAYNGSALVAVISKRMVVNDDSSQVTNIDFTGNSQQITLKVGRYKVELWGAQGGGSIGGLGAYTSGIITVNEQKDIYVYVGGQGGTSTSLRSTGGFNGGGQGYSVSTTYPGTAGGGATDIRFFSSTPTTEQLVANNATGLADRIMVAAGGGGSSLTANKGSDGGTLAGIYVDGGSTAGTQTAGGIAATLTKNGTNGGFGFGGNSGEEAVGGGGAGYYGGAGASQASGNNKSGPSGSSYISGYTGCVAITAVDNITPKDGCTDGTTDINCSYHFSGISFDEPVMKSGSEEMPTHDGTGTMTGNTGNGYAKITSYIYYK